MPRKLILCRCEDVTASDIANAVASGFDDLEEVKRYTGFGTGPCQGKECLRAVAFAITAATGRPLASLRPFTTRPPLAPTELRFLAASGPVAAPRDPSLEAGAGVRTARADDQTEEVSFTTTKPARTS